MDTLDVAGLLEQIDDIQAQTGSAGVRGAPGITTADLAQHLKITHNHASGRIKDLIDRGVLKYSGKQLRPNRCGIMQPTHVYVPVKATQKKS